MTRSANVAFPYFGNREHDHFEGTDHESVLLRSVPARKLKLADGDTLVATVFDLFVANYGLDRGLEDSNSAKSFDDDLPYTPAWAETITGVPRDQIITVAREFARNAEKTNGRSMVILGAGLNQLVPHGHELPRHHQSPGDVRLCRPVRWWLEPLCRPGKTASADRLAAAGLQPRLEPSAPADELHIVLLRPHRPVALRYAESGRDPVSDGTGRPVGWHI